MKSPADINRELLAIAEPVVRASGYELVDVEYAGSPSGWVVRVYIDRPSDTFPPPDLGPIGLVDCERISRELGAVLDVEDPLPHAYSLEVSSPGLDRPLRTAEHFRRFAGETAKVALARPLDGRKNFKGTLRGVEGEGEAAQVVIEVDGTAFRLPIGDVASARIVPDWDAVMRARQGALRAARERRGRAQR
ncbi:MAG TPA: ribosome maturation factor RimP [Kofleriaceae bacterium]|nr:ribosome maturation factor RimP [Kofleriaceae bacterium]